MSILLVVLVIPLDVFKGVDVEVLLVVLDTASASGALSLMWSTPPVLFSASILELELENRRLKKQLAEAGNA